jgi:hypothetical protein
VEYTLEENCYLEAYVACNNDQCSGQLLFTKYKHTSDPIVPTTGYFEVTPRYSNAVGCLKLICNGECAICAECALYAVFGLSISSGLLEVKLVTTT